MASTCIALEVIFVRCMQFHGMHINYNLLVAIVDKFVFCNIRMKGISHSERDGFMSWMTPIRLGMRQNAFHHLW